MLRLIVPGFASRLRAAAPMPRLPALEKLMARGTVTTTLRTLPGWSSWRLDTLALLGLQADRWHASAPLEWLGQGEEPRKGSWLQGEFVHLEMGSHSARLQRIEALEVGAATALREALASHLQGSVSMALASPGSTTRFFLHSAQTFEAICPAPDFDADADMQELLPQGRNGAELRRLLTEVQMLLHEHPVNTQRERKGLHTANAVWLSGLGDFDSFRPLPLPRIWSDEPYIRGVCRLHDQACEQLPFTAVAVLEDRRPGVVVMPASETTDLQKLEKDWFAPLAVAVSRGQLPEMELFLDRWQVSVNRAALRRFWRRGSLSGLLQ